MAELVAESAPSEAEAEQIVELDRRWAAVQAGEKKFSNDDVVRWLETWGAPAYKLGLLNAAYIFQYRYGGESLVMLRVFHGRELRQ